MLNVTVDMLTSTIVNSDQYSQKEKEFIIKNIHKISLVYEQKFNKSLTFKLF